MPHRKEVKHYEDRRCVHELTFSCYRRRPLLLNEDHFRLLSQSVDRAIQRYNFQLIAFVWMPEHVHLLVLPSQDKYSISNLLFAIKRPASFRIKKLLETTDQKLLEQLTIRQRPGRKTFRFWQEGPGYDRNLFSSNAVESAIDYIHNNPVKRGLCIKPTDWKWSSARNYHLDRFFDKDLPSVTLASYDLID